MPGAKRLRNADGLRGDLTEAQGGTAAKQLKRGLKGDSGASGRFSAKTGTEHAGVTAVVSGDVGVGGGANTFIPRGASAVGDSRSILDSDPHFPGGDDEQTVLATFTVATGAGAAGTFEYTAENTGGNVRVSVFSRGTDTDEDEDLLGVFYGAASGAAVAIALGATFAGVTVAVYAQKVDAAGRSFGPFFATRRTVAAHA